MHPNIINSRPSTDNTALWSSTLVDIQSEFCHWFEESSQWRIKLLWSPQYHWLHEAVIGYQGWPRRAKALSRASRLAPRAERSLGSDPDLVSRGAAVPARRRPGRRCCVTSGFERTSDGLVFGYWGFAQLPQLAESTSWEATRPGRPCDPARRGQGAHCVTALHSGKALIMSACTQHLSYPLQPCDLCNR